MVRGVKTPRSAEQKWAQKIPRPVLRADWPIKIKKIILKKIKKNKWAKRANPLTLVLGQPVSTPFFADINGLWYEKCGPAIATPRCGRKCLVGSWNYQRGSSLAML